MAITRFLYGKVEKFSIEGGYWYNKEYRMKINEYLLDDIIRLYEYNAIDEHITDDFIKLYGYYNRVL